MKKFVASLIIFLCSYFNNGYCQTTFSNEFLYKNLEKIIGKYKIKDESEQNKQIEIKAKDKFGLYKLPNSDRYGFHNPSDYQNNFISNKPQINQFDPQQYVPNDVNPSKYGLYSPQNTQQQVGIIEALHSIAYYDSLQCIPKLLCEFMVENRYSTQQDSSSSYLPNIDLSSILGYLNALGGLATPLLVFGKAALVGYTANGDNYKCTESYPRCPKDPDRLVEYLNNHNGGFFRFFNGVPQKFPQYPQNQQNAQYQQYQQYLQNLQYSQYQQYPQYDGIQKRIQTRPSNYGTAAHQEPPTQSVNWKISNSNQYKQKEYVYVNGRFVPIDQNINQEFLYDNGKYIPINGNKKFKSITFSNSQQIPSNSQVGVLFPDRTGTGELILDTEKFFTQNSNMINFNNYRIRFPERD